MYLHINIHKYTDIPLYTYVHTLKSKKKGMMIPKYQIIIYVNVCVWHTTYIHTYIMITPDVKKDDDDDDWYIDIIYLDVIIYIYNNIHNIYFNTFWPKAVFTYLLLIMKMKV